VACADDDLVIAALIAGQYIVLQRIGNDVIEPYVMGHELWINTAMVLIAVTAGGLL